MGNSGLAIRQMVPNSGPMEPLSAAITRSWPCIRGLAESSVRLSHADAVVDEAGDEQEGR